MGKLKDWLSGVEYSLLSGTEDIDVEDVIFDSRKAAANTVFVCIKGSTTDSHDFISDVKAKGCRTFVVEKELQDLGLENTSNLNIIYTKNTRKALAYMSAARFGYPLKNMKIIGITGTKGKTSTSYMMKKVLEKGGYKVGLIGTNGCMIGDERTETKNTTPDSYELQGYFRKMCDAGCSFAVMECSSQGFKMDRTEGIKFDFGMFLNLSSDHIGPLEHKDFDEYMFCKSRLINNCRTAVVNLDDSHTDEIIKLANGGYDKLISFSLKSSKADIYAHDIEYLRDENFTGTCFNVSGIINDKIKLSIPGEINVANALPVIAVAVELGIDHSCIKEALGDIHVDGRMEVAFKNDKMTVIVDYAHNGISMESLMKTLRAYEHNRLVVVFGCGGNRSKERRYGMGRSAAASADFSVFTSDNSRFEKTEDIMADIEQAYLEAGGKKDGYIKIKDRREAIRYAMENAEKGDIIAVIGKGHEDYQEENGVKVHFLDREEIIKIGAEL